MLSGVILLALTAGSPLDLPPGDPAVGLPVLEEMAPLAPLGEVERHTPETLWEKIDGEAELYRRFGLVRSVSASFGLGDPPDRRVEVSVFDLGTPLGAFGVFASFRAPEDRVEGLGNGAVVGDHLAFFWHGRFFVLADAAGPDATRAGDLRRAVDSSAGELGSPPPRPPALATFEGMAAPGSVRFLPDHLLGREALPPGLEGETAAGLGLFAGTSPAPEGVLDSYATALVGERRLSWGDALVLTGTDPALGPVTVAVMGTRLAGARDRAESQGVRQAIERLLLIDDEGR